MSKKKSQTPKTDTPRQDAFESAWEKFRPLVPENELAAVEASFAQPLSPSFRINSLKMHSDELAQMSQCYGWELEQIPFCDSGYRVCSWQIAPSQTAEHRIGCYYIQDSASMLPVSLFDQSLLEDAPLVLDLAASPGGKTTHIIDRSHDRGLVIANDSSLSRISALRTVLRNWGSLNHAITNFPGENFGNWFPDTFDLVLLDAPCSMQSLVSIDSHPMRPITVREENSLAQRQTALLESALHALRPGGQLVYSTCTLSPDEDEAVVDRMLKRFQGKVRVLNTGERLPYPAPGLTHTPTQEFDPSLSESVRLWPHRYRTAGFFAALLQKDDSFETSVMAAPERPWSKSSFSELSVDKASELRLWLKDQLGLDLNALLQDTACELWRRAEEVWMIPQRFTSFYSSLPCKSTGMKVASISVTGWIPDNDWVSRFLQRIKGKNMALDAEQASIWLHGQDIQIPGHSYSKGDIILIANDTGVFLGCGRISGERIRNLRK